MGEAVGLSKTSRPTAPGWLAATTAATWAPNELPSSRAGRQPMAASHPAISAACPRMDRARRGLSL